MEPLFRPKRVAIRPFECLRLGLRRVLTEPLSFAGLGAIVAVGTQVPLGLVLGPFLVGAHRALLEHERTGRLRVERVFDGFQDFLQAWIVMLLHLAATLALMLPVYVLLFGAMLLLTALEVHPAVLVVLFALVGLALLLATIALYVPFGFAPGLVAERRLSAADAVRISARAARVNFWGLLGLWLLMYALCVAGLLLCVLPFFFVFPVCLAALYEAFRRVLGEAPPEPEPAVEPLIAA